MAVICRISGFWSSKAVLLVSFSISVPRTETLASKPITIPQMKWAGNSFLLISALVGSVGWKKGKKKLLFALHICPDVPGSCLLHQRLHIASAHHCLPDSRLRSGGRVASRFWFFFSQKIQLLVCQQHEPRQRKKEILLGGDILTRSRHQASHRDQRWERRAMAGMQAPAHGSSLGSSPRSSFLLKF